jgi:hypothetical protein
MGRAAVYFFDECRLEHEYLVFRLNIQVGGGIEARGMTKMGSLDFSLWPEPEREEVTSGTRHGVTRSKLLSLFGFKYP